MSSSTRKDSFASSTTTHSNINLETGSGANTYNYDDQAALPPRQPAPSCDRRIYPATAPHRPLYLAARSLALALGLILIALAVVAQRAIDRDTWMAPVLSPAIQSCFANGVDLWFIFRKNLRAVALQRLVYDGLLAVGFAIAAGFLVAFTLGDLRQTREGSSAATAAVGAAILFCMFAEM